MSEATFYPSGTEAAKTNEPSFVKTIGNSFKEVDRQAAEEFGDRPQSKKMLKAAAWALVGGAGAWVGNRMGGDAGSSIAIFGGLLATASGVQTLYHATQTKLAKSFVAAAKTFDDTTGLSKSVNSFVSAAKKHVVAATRKEIEMPVEYGSEEGTVTAGVSKDNRSVMSRVFDYMKAKRTK